jgi:hypothetical protein
MMFLSLEFLIQALSLGAKTLIDVINSPKDKLEPIKEISFLRTTGKNSTQSVKTMRNSHFIN